MFRKIWNSPIFMTWGNLTAKSSNLVVLIPIVLRTFSKEDVVIWYLYFTVVSLQLLIDFGFLPTFSRLFSYAYSGLNINQIKDIRNNKIADGIVNRESIDRLYFATRTVYLWLAIVSCLLAVSFGSYMVYEPMNRSTHPTSAWGGWLAVIIIASFNLYANSLVAFLQGINRIALVQRWQMVTSFLAVVSSACTVYLTHSLCFGILAYYIWQIINYFINMYLLKKEYTFGHSVSDSNEVRDIVYNIIWPTAWRSGFGVMMSMGLIQLSGMVVAKIETAAQAASYMLALQIVRTASSFSQAPFYSRLPYYTQLYSQNLIKELIANSMEGMKKSYYVFIFFFFSIGILAQPLLSILGSKSDFVSLDLWVLICFGFLVERFGAMYLQLYTLTNVIIWHIANGITGLLMIIFSFVLQNTIGIYAFPVSMLASYLVFFAPYVIRKTYKEFNISFIKNESGTFLQAVLIFCIVSSIMFIVQRWL